MSCRWLRVVSLFLLTSRSVILSCRYLKYILDKVLVLLVLLRVQVCVLASLLHRLCWSVQNWHNDLLRLTAIKSVVLVYICRLDVASQVVVLVLVLFQLRL